MELLEAGERVCTKCATEKPVAFNEDLVALARLLAYLAERKEEQ